MTTVHYEILVVLHNSINQLVLSLADSQSESPTYRRTDLHVAIRCTTFLGRTPRMDTDLANDMQLMSITTVH